MNKVLEESNGSAEGTDKQNLNSELVTYSEVKGTPFTIAKVVKEKHTEYYILMGKYRVQEEGVSYIAEKEAIKEAKTITWEKIMQVISVMIIEQKKLK